MEQNSGYGDRLNVGERIKHGFSEIAVQAESSYASARGFGVNKDELNEKARKYHKAVCKKRALEIILGRSRRYPDEDEDFLRELDNYYNLIDEEEIENSISGSSKDTLQNEADNLEQQIRGIMSYRGAISDEYLDLSFRQVDELLDKCLLQYRKLELYRSINKSDESDHSAGDNESDKSGPSFRNIPLMAAHGLNFVIGKLKAIRAARATAKSSGAGTGDKSTTSSGEKNGNMSLEEAKANYARMRVEYERSGSLRGRKDNLSGRLYNAREALEEALVDSLIKDTKGDLTIQRFAAYVESEIDSIDKKTGELYREMLDNRSWLSKASAKIGKWFVGGEKGSRLGLGGWLRSGGTGLASGVAIAMLGVSFPITSIAGAVAGVGVKFAAHQRALENEGDYQNLEGRAKEKKEDYDAFMRKLKRDNEGIIYDRERNNLDIRHAISRALGYNQEVSRERRATIRAKSTEAMGAFTTGLFVGKVVGGFAKTHAPDIFRMFEGSDSPTSTSSPAEVASADPSADPSPEHSTPSPEHSTSTDIDGHTDPSDTDPGSAEADTDGSDTGADTDDSTSTDIDGHTDPSDTDPGNAEATPPSAGDTTGVPDINAVPVTIGPNVEPWTFMADHYGSEDAMKKLYEAAEILRQSGHSAEFVSVGDGMSALTVDGVGDYAVVNGMIAQALGISI